jgi:hypothetical protein
MFEKRIMADLRGRIDGWWNLSNSTKDDSKRTRVRLRSPNTWLARPDQSRSALFSALDNAFRFIDGNDRKKSNGNGGWKSPRKLGFARAVPGFV